MAKREHLAVPVGEHRPEDGWFLKHVEPCADNTSFAVLESDRHDRGQRVVFGGRVIPFAAQDLTRFSLSFDGKRLATAHRRWDDEVRGHEVLLNGDFAYEAPISTLHHLDWLDDERLAWDGWNESARGGIDDGGIRRFVNGKEIGGSFDFEPIRLDRMRRAVRVREGGKAWVVYDDGTRSDPVPVAEDTARHEWDRELFPARPFDEGPQVRREADEPKARVVWNGAAGPAFDGIDGDGFGTFRSSESGLIAYVGMNYAGLARTVGGLVGGAIERAGASEERGKTPLWAWPIALLFNPYFGIGHALIEGSRRYHPVVSGEAIAGPGGDSRPELRSKVWKKGYRRVADLFFAGEHELAVVVHDGRSMRLVLDEDEGPAFEAVWNARVGADGRVHYLAKRGDRFLKVTVDGG